MTLHSKSLCERSEAIHLSIQIPGIKRKLSSIHLDYIQSSKSTLDDLERMDRQPAIYILTNKPRGTLYTGVTSQLVARIWQHKNKVTPGFSAKYNLTRLVYFELYGDMYEAISREKQIKGGSRIRKIRLIENKNPEWVDLYPRICN